MSEGVPLGSLRLHHRDEADLVWWLAEEWKGVIGIRSNVGRILDTLERQAVIQASPRPADYLPDEDDPRMGVARRLRYVEARLGLVPRRHLETLKRVHAPRGPLRPGGLEVFRNSETGDELGGLVLTLSEAARAHKRARSKQDLLSWLRCVSDRFRCGRGSRKVKRHDVEVVARLNRAAVEAYLEAVRAYKRSGRRRLAA